MNLFCDPCFIGVNPVNRNHWSAYVNNPLMLTLHLLVTIRVWITSSISQSYQIPARQLKMTGSWILSIWNIGEVLCKNGPYCDLAVKKDVLLNMLKVSRNKDLGIYTAFCLVTPLGLHKMMWIYFTSEAAFSYSWIIGLWMLLHENRLFFV